MYKHTTDQRFSEYFKVIKLFFSEFFLGCVEEAEFLHPLRLTVELLQLENFFFPSMESLIICVAETPFSFPSSSLLLP